VSDLERPILREDFDNLPREVYAGLGYATHRFADFIPVADDKDQYALRESIKTVGLLDEIVLFEGAILDGRHRYKACQVVGVEPRFREFDGDEEAALQFVLAKNVARRQLSTIQKLTLREKLMPEIERLRAKARANQAAGTSVQDRTEAVGRVADEVGKMIQVGKTTQHQFDAVRAIAAEHEEADTFLQDMLAGNIGVEKAYKAAKAVSISDQLDALAKQDTSKSDAMKQKAALAANIKKAHDLVINADPGILTPDFELNEKLFDLLEWLKEAYDYTR
jgi:ParB-like chromosome segregation protein Spo0J